MAYNQNNPLPRMNSALKRSKADKKLGLSRNSSPINNASQYGIHGVDELKYMPIIDDMHRKQDSPAYLSSEEEYNTVDDITQDDGKADRDGMSRNASPLNKDNWIQEATADIKERGTEGVCTGDKFGGPTCPPGSKRYNLAKTFKKMAKNR